MSEYRKVISSEGAYQGPVKAKEEGLIGHIGMSSHSLDLIKKNLEWLDAPQIFDEPKR